MRVNQAVFYMFGACHLRCVHCAGVIAYEYGYVYVGDRAYAHLRCVSLPSRHRMEALIRLTLACLVAFVLASCATPTGAMGGAAFRKCNVFSGDTIYVTIGDTTHYSDTLKFCQGKR